MCSLVRAPALLVSVQFLIITLVSILRKAHLSFKGKQGYQERAHLIPSLFPEPLALTEEQNVLCVTLHEYCWWFCKIRVGRQFGTGFPDGQTLSLSASFFCKIRITTCPALPQQHSERSTKVEEKISKVHWSQRWTEYRCSCCLIMMTLLHNNLVVSLLDSV